MNYYDFPYLAGSTTERLAARFQDVFINTSELNAEGGIIPRMGIQDEFPLIEKFTHLTEEWSARGGLPTEVVADARKPFLRYFDNGSPAGLDALASFEAPSSTFLVKYSKRQFLEPMLKNGTIRICPASYYSDSNHIASVRDTETTKSFLIPTFRERLRGETSINLDGREIKFGNDDLEISIEAQDYFLYSLSDQLYYRLPTDFEADAALVIRDPVRFSQLVISTFLSMHSGWSPIVGPVTYYDPYIDYTKISAPEMSKNFGYSYQQEYRIVLRSLSKLSGPLQPEFLSIGPMTAYAELVTF